MQSACLAIDSQANYDVDYASALGNDVSSMEILSLKNYKHNLGLYYKDAYNVSSHLPVQQDYSGSRGVAIADDPKSPKEYAHKINVETISPHASGRTETIKMWWSGTITEVDREQDSIFATVVDTNGNYSRVEFAISNIVDSPEDDNVYLYIGSRFVYYITKVQGYGTPLLTSKIEFIAPYIWKESDNEKVEKLKSSLFPLDMLG